MFEIRLMHAHEAQALGMVMWSAIHDGASLYTRAQRRAWLPAPHQSPEWAAKLAGQTVWVACRGDGPLGVMTLAEQGYVDLAYVHADAQGQGVFSALQKTLEREARARSLPRLWTHASLMAQPAFAARGFHVIAHEKVERAGQTLARAEMEKVLT
ncbi:MAG: GNAT family N-acetyltransferase [Pseudomonadota bacterium]